MTSPSNNESPGNITARGMIELGDTFACAAETILRERYGITRKAIELRPLQLLETLGTMTADELVIVRILGVAIYATGHELDNAQRVATLAQGRPPG